MRFWPALTLACLMGGLAAATPVAGAELKPLPVFFQQSWDAVKAQPLAAMSAPRPAATEARALLPTNPAPPPPPAGDEPSTRSVATLSIPMPAGESHAEAPESAVLPLPATPGLAAPAVSAAAAPPTEPVPSAAPEPVLPSAPAPTAAPAPSAIPAAAPMPAAALAPPAAPPEGAEPSPPAEAAPGAVALAQPPEPPVRPGTGETEAKPAVPVTLNVPANVRVRDRSSFIIGKTVYRLATTDGLGINTRCSVEKGKGCFWRPMRSLKVAIAGATLFCRPATGGAWTCSKKQAAAQR